MLPQSPPDSYDWAQAHWDDAKYDRQALLDELKAAYAAAPTDVGVMWRLTRAAYDVAHLNATSAAQKKELIYYAYDLIQKAEPLGKHIAEVHNWCVCSLCPHRHAT
ncbi:hypothetical protein PINS_up017511 [Pythium insidiosum]|nr:hypothetical protein PINS_up017511 [Pythium insidiosum]